jgi:ABC-type uncharacterized transport system fused permease/ATPase subunit
MLSNPVNTMLRTIPTLKAALACFDRIERFLESPSRKLFFGPLQELSQTREQILEKIEPNDDIASSNDTSKEKLTTVDSSLRGQPELSSTVIQARNAAFSWTAGGSNIIEDLNLSVARKDFVFIVGPVGCGKSTLLKGLMSETPFFLGTLQRHTSTSAFVDQKTWVQNTTIRGNIIGPSILDDAWYEEVIAACALNYDIARMPESHGA